MIPKKPTPSCWDRATVRPAATVAPTGKAILQRAWIRIESMVFLRSNPVENTRALLLHLKSRFKVEGDRFHMVGFSANSAGAFQVVLALRALFQHITVIPGYLRTGDEAMLKRLKNTRIQFIVGAAYLLSIVQP